MILLLLLPILNYAQGKPLKKKEMSTSASTVPKQIQFTQMWGWEYQNFDGEKGEMVAYYNPKSNYWLLTEETYGNTDGMCDWILATPNGQYYFAYKSAEFGSKNSLLKQNIKFPVNATMPDYFKPTGQKKDFGDPSYGFPKILGSAYSVKYEKTNDKTTLYIGNSTANLTPIYHFNTLIADAKLPIFFPTDLPKGKIALAEHTITSGRTVTFKLKYISHIDYHIDLSDYE